MSKNKDRRTTLVVPLTQREDYAEVKIKVWVSPDLIADPDNEALATIIADEARKKIYEAVLRGRPDSLR